MNSLVNAAAIADAARAVRLEGVFGKNGRPAVRRDFTDRQCGITGALWPTIATTARDSGLPGQRGPLVGLGRFPRTERRLLWMGRPRRRAWLLVEWRRRL